MLVQSYGDRLKDKQYNQRTSLSEYTASITWV